MYVRVQRHEELLHKLELPFAALTKRRFASASMPNESCASFLRSSTSFRGLTVLSDTVACAVIELIHVNIIHRTILGLVIIHRGKFHRIQTGEPRPPGYGLGN